MAARRYVATVPMVAGESERVRVMPDGVAIPTDLPDVDRLRSL